MGSLGRQEWRRGIVIGAVLTACGILWIFLGLPHGIPSFPADWQPAAKYVFATDIVALPLMLMVFCMVRYYGKGHIRELTESKLRTFSRLITGITVVVCAMWLITVYIFWSAASFAGPYLVWGIVPAHLLFTGLMMLCWEFIVFTQMYQLYSHGKQTDPAESP